MIISEGKVDAVAFGKTAIANPETFYASGSGGYTDYPML